MGLEKPSDVVFCQNCFVEEFLLCEAIDWNATTVLEEVVPIPSSHGQTCSSGGQCFSKTPIYWLQ